MLSIVLVLMLPTAGNILTVADDLLKNDGQKFLEMMEQLAEHRTNREDEAAESVAAEEDDEDDDEDDEDDEGDEEYEDDLDKVRAYSSLLFTFPTPAAPRLHIVFAAGPVQSTRLLVLCTQII